VTRIPSAPPAATRLRVIREHQEGAAVRESGRHAGTRVHRRAHAELAHAVETRNCRALAPDDPGGLYHREVRPGEVGRAAEQLRQRGAPAPRAPAARLAGRDGLGLLARFLQEERNLLVEITGAAGPPSARLNSAARPGTASRTREQPVPAPLGALARSRASQPGTRSRDLEGGMAPAERLPGGGNLLVAERRAVRRPGAGLGRSAFAMTVLAADQRRARLSRFALRNARSTASRSWPSTFAITCSRTPRSAAARRP